jgi:hypothetical protein
LAGSTPNRCLRSLAYALVDTLKDGNPSEEGFACGPALPQQRARRKDDPWRLAQRQAEQRCHGRSAADRARWVAADASARVIELLNKGRCATVDFRWRLRRSGEIAHAHAREFWRCTRPRSRTRFITLFSIATTTTPRRLLLVQNAAFIPLFRAQQQGSAVRIDELEPAKLESKGEEAVAEIFADVSRNDTRLNASRKILAYLQNKGDVRLLADTARRLIFLKGNNAHDYKYSSAVLEDYEHLSPPWRDRYLASSVFNLRGSGDNDNDLVKRIRSALG